MKEDATAKSPVARTDYSLLLRLALAAAIVLVRTVLSRAGGPKCVAGTSFFDPTVIAQPLLWPQGQLHYYADQDDLSPLLHNADANNFVAAAFSQWTSVPTAVLIATNGGQLAEEVNGTNVTRNADRAQLPCPRTYSHPPLLLHEESSTTTTEVSPTL